MANTPPPIPKRSDGERRSKFDWKPYGTALIWMFPALTLFTFCTIVLYPRVVDIWDASGLQTSNPTLHWMRRSIGTGGTAAKFAFAALALVMVVAEGFLKGHERLRRVGCGLIAFLTNFSAIVMITCAALILSVVAPVLQDKLTTHRRFAALSGTLNAVESIANTRRQDVPVQATAIDPSEVDALDELDRSDLLDAAIILVEKAENPVLRRQALGQALILLEHERGEDAEINSKRLLEAAATMNDSPFTSIAGLTAWFEANSGKSGWEAIPISIVE